MYLSIIVCESINTYGGLTIEFEHIMNIVFFPNIICHCKVYVILTGHSEDTATISSWSLRLRPCELYHFELSLVQCAPLPHKHIAGKGKLTTLNSIHFHCESGFKHLQTKHPEAQHDHS